MDRITAPRETLSAQPALAGVAILVMAVVIPTALALGLHAELRLEAPTVQWWPSWLKLPRRQTAYESTPTAWDKAAPRQGDKWIRISLPNGQRVGGWMSGASLVSTYPQPRDVFIQEQFPPQASSK
ncbi:DUF6338 family protein [Curtobacterium sp. MCBD17_035]|uniref:DUF6338 family protein n=1 Tax=Curtobacterium sp. MCBD17_035 TaxID=2175673 RepID=UPI000DA9BBBD|nr:DUF6338 family protein [Curtobacterium sp. MCBD17_035]WIB67743.1 DUF6338 family protein [Curtobacterium sp. MCBD17_035]